MLYCDLREAYDNNSRDKSLTNNGNKPLHKKNSFYQGSQTNLPTGNKPNAEIPDNIYNYEPNNHGLTSEDYGTNQVRGNFTDQFTANQELVNYNPNPKVMFMDDTSEIIIPKRKKRSHPYYIKKFLESITDDDLMSMASNYDNDMYQHIMSCKYCRMKIRYEMKKQFVNQAAMINSNNYNTIANQGHPIYHIQHFDPTLTMQQQLQQQQLQQQQLQQQLPQQQLQPSLEKRIEVQNIRKEKNYEQYLLIFVVVILVLFLFADIVIKIIK